MKNNQEEYAILAGIYREIAESMGIDTAKELHQYFKGQQVNFPVRLYDAAYLSEKICEEYKNGENVRDLSVKYGYTERRVRQIIHGKDEKEKTKRNT